MGTAASGNAGRAPWLQPAAVNAPRANSPKTFPDRSPKPMKSAPNLLSRLSSAFNAVAPEDTEANGGSTSLQQQESTEAIAACIPGSSPSISKQSNVHLAAEDKPPKRGSQTPPRKSLTGEDVTYSEDEMATMETSESCCQPAAADSPLAVSNCHMLHFLAQQGRQTARTDSTLGLLKQSSMKLGGSASRVQPQLSRRFADIVAQVHDRQKEQPDRLVDFRLPAVSLPVQKGRCTPDAMCAQHCGFPLQSALRLRYRTAV